MTVRVALSAVVLLSVSICGNSRTLQLTDLAEQVAVSRPTIAPDGRRIAIVTSQADFATNRQVRSLVIVDAGTGALQSPAAGYGQVDAPQWSPSGDRLAWLDGDEHGKAQIHVAATATVANASSHFCVTRTSQGVRSFKWSSNGQFFAFIAADSAVERSGEEHYNRSFDAGGGDFLATAAPAPSHVWIVPAHGGEARRLTSGASSVRQLEWLPGDTHIALISQPTPLLADFLDQSLEKVDVRDGTRTVLVSEAKAIYQPPLPSPDGRLIAFWRPRGEGRSTFSHAGGISAIAPSGGASRELTPTIDRDIRTMVWWPDSKAVVVAAPDATRYGLWFQPLKGSPRALDLGSVAVLSDLSVSRAGVLAFIGSEPDSPAELYVKTSLDARPRRLTHFNEPMAHLDQGRVETVRWKSGGFEHNGVLFYPPGFETGTRVPLVLNVHGGPYAPSWEGWHESRMDGFNRVLAAKGWAVFSPNYRGTGSQGSVYQSAAINDAGDGPGRDVMAGVAIVKALGIVDETRIAVSGHSYGGFMTTWLAAHYTGWRVAVAVAPPTDFIDMYNLSDENVGWGGSLQGSPWTRGNIENYRRHSSITFADRIRAPMLILSGTHDRRVPITQSYKLFHALKDNDVPVSFVAYPDVGHWPADPVHERDIYARWIEWISRNFATP